MPHQAKSIANAFIALANKDGREIDPLKLQKLLYYANGYYMAEHDGLPLINEYFEAWDYGPVVPTVYYEFREYRNSPIRRYAYTFDERIGRSIVAPVPIAADVSEVVSWVWNQYKDYSGATLSRMTHKEGAPWDRARKRAANHGMRNERLDLNELMNHFSQLV